MCQQACHAKQHMHNTKPMPLPRLQVVALLQLLLPLQLAPRLSSLRLPLRLRLSSQALPQGRLRLRRTRGLLGSQLLLPGGAHVLHEPAAGGITRRLLCVTLCLLCLRGSRQLGVPCRTVRLLPLHLCNHLLTVGHRGGPPRLTSGTLLGLCSGCRLQPRLHNVLVRRLFLGSTAGQFGLALPAWGRMTGDAGR